MKNGMKRILALLLVLCVFGFAAACGQEGEPPATPPPAAAPSGTPDSSDVPPADEGPIPLKIGFCWHINTDEVFSTYSHFVNAIVDEINAEGVYQIELIETSAGNDSTKQMSDVESLIQMECDAIMFSAVDQEASAAMVETIAAAGIPCINSYKMTSSDAITCKIHTMDHYYIGELYAQWLDEWMEANPDVHLNIAFVSGNPAQPDTLKRAEAFEAEFLPKWEDSGRITYLGTQNGEQNAEKAIVIAEDWLQSNPEINCFVSSSDMMTYGMYNVCKAAGREDMLFVTGDGTAAVCQEIEEGNLQMTIGMDKKTICKVVVETCIEAAQGHAVEKEINAASAAVVVIDSPEDATAFLDGMGLR